MKKNKPVSTRRSSFSLAAMLVGICLSFLGIIFISVIYIAKDYYAYNSVYAFFGIDSQTLLWLMGLPVGQKTLLRLLNFSHACFIVCSVMFAMSFSSLLPERVARFLGWLIGAIWLVQVVFLDPQFLSWLYMERIGVFDNVRFFRGFYRWLVRLLRWFSVGWILFAAGLLVGAFFRTPASLRTGTALVALLFSCLAFLYIYLFSWLPVQALWMSRVADYISFESLPIYRPTAFNIYARTLTFLLMGLFFFAAAWMILKNSRNSRYDRIFRSKVSAVEVVSRVFCHYLKNELLSQQAELKLLEVKVQPELKEDVRFIMQRNDDIYRRLTTVRETMKQKKDGAEPSGTDRASSEGRGRDEYTGGRGASAEIAGRVGMGVLQPGADEGGAAMPDPERTGIRPGRNSEPDRRASGGAAALRQHRGQQRRPADR